MAATAPPTHDTAFFGHPRGLSTLFFTEMWERFSYYGIRALLILYMTAAVTERGMGLDVATAGAIYGLYTSCAYIFAMPAGWIADRFIGHQKSVVIGGALIILGNFGLMLGSLGAFVFALLLMAIGTGFLKTSCTTVVGFLYGEGDRRRDSGFTLYYVGINIGAGIAPLICGYVGENIDYRYAFGLAGLFMAAGVIQFALTKGYLHESGREPATTATGRDRSLLGIGSAILVAAVATLFLVQASLEAVADGFAALLLIAVAVTFAGFILSKDFSPVEKKRIYVILVLFVASAIFWSIFEQAGSTLNLFARDSTETVLFGFDFPVSWFQSLNPAYIYLLGPFLAWFWIRLGDSNPSLVTKFAFGLLGAGGGFLVMMLAAQTAGAGRVGPQWLATVYLIHTVGELCLSPVGLSAMTKLAPARIAGFTMGVWFLSVSFGNFFAGRLASFYEALPLDRLVGYAGATGVIMGVILLVISKPITRLMGGVK